jgi:hypothetical protein
LGSVPAAAPKISSASECAITCLTGQLLLKLPTSPLMRVVLNSNVKDCRNLFPGMLPLARELLQRGTAVVLAANSRPSINDITADELRAVVQRAAAADAILGRAVDEQMLTVIPSGNDLPVIDLRKVGCEWPFCTCSCACLSEKHALRYCYREAPLEPAESRVLHLPFTC